MKQLNQHINTSQLKKILFLMVILLSFTAIASYAGPRGFSDPDTPIDGGISLLVATGVGIGVKKVREMRKKKKETEQIADSKND